MNGIAVNLIHGVAILAGMVVALVPSLGDASIERPAMGIMFAIIAMLLRMQHQIIEGYMRDIRTTLHKVERTLSRLQATLERGASGHEER